MLDTVVGDVFKIIVAVGVTQLQIVISILVIFDIASSQKVANIKNLPAFFLGEQIRDFLTFG